MTSRALLGIIGGLLVGLGIGGGAAAIVESVTMRATTVPIVISGLGMGLGIGFIVVCLMRAEGPEARLSKIDVRETRRLLGRRPG